MVYSPRKYGVPLHANSRNMIRISAFIFVISFLSSCINKPVDPSATTEGKGVVNIYTHRHYDSDRMVFDKFEKETGIRVNIVSANADELLVKLENEMELTPCDLFVTVDAARLLKAKEKNLLQPVNSATLNKNIAPQFRDPEGYWFAQTIRGRVLAVKKGLKAANPQMSYEDLASPQWKGKVLMRSSGSEYNQALLASIIAHRGEAAARDWTRSVVANFARPPRGNDRDQVKDIAAGRGEVTLVNTYYLGKMQKSDDPLEKKALSEVEIIFPNQSGYGTHINISGAGVARYSKNRDNAVKLLEFLSRPDIQQEFALNNEEYPVSGKLAAKGILAELGEFVADTLRPESLARYNAPAVRIFDEAGWK